MTAAGDCADTCGEHETTDDQGICVACPDTCATGECEWNSQLLRTVCTGCPDGLFLFDSSCVASCPIGTGVNDGVCEDCGTDCLVCDDADGNDIKACSICVNGYGVENSGDEDCVETCPSGFYIEQGTPDFCDQCHFSCEECIGGGDSTDCYQCSQSTVLQSVRAVIAYLNGDTITTIINDRYTGEC